MVAGNVLWQDEGRSAVTKNVRLRRIMAVVGAIVVVIVIVWVDVASGIWQEFVILAGVAAGVVTFILTVLVLDRVLARSTARRWSPVNRLALSEFLHALADEEHSEISRGHIVPRSLPRVPIDPPPEDPADELHRLREIVVAERRILADTLSRWAQFLASSGENEAVLLHVADIALRLDGVRDAALDAEITPDGATLRVLDLEIVGCNAALQALVGELRGRLVPTGSPRSAVTV